VKTETKNHMMRLLSLVATIFLLVSCTTQFSSTVATTGESDKTGVEDVIVSFDSESVYFTQEELMNQADLIFAGTVLDISPTRWNQDSGEYWSETTEEGVTATGEKLTTTHSAWPVYEVKLSVDTPIVDEVGIGKEVTLTLLGKSPIGEGVNSEAGNIQVDAETVNLQNGQELVVFAWQTELAWRDPNRPIELATNANGDTYFDIGTRSIITLMGLPANAYLVKGSDGLYYPAEGSTNEQEPISSDDLTLSILQKRESSSSTVK